MGGNTVSHVHAPDSRAAAEIENSLGILNGREVEFVVEEHEEHVVSYVELIILDFIVRTPVLALSELVVASPIFIAVFPDSGWNRRCIAQVVRITICGISLIKVGFLPDVSVESFDEVITCLRSRQFTS